MWGALLALMVIQKPIFMAVEPAYAWRDMSMVLNVLFHGLAMDLSMSAYLVAPLAILTVVSLWVSPRRLMATVSGYLWVAAVLVVMAGVADAVLFPYWGFRLDSTPLFYFMTSPSSALASASWLVEVLALLLIVALSWAVYRGLKYVARRTMMSDEHTSLTPRIVKTVAMLAVSALLIVPIRGGVTVSTMSPGRCYFSDDMRLNYAAQNPLFMFMYSVAHADKLAEQFRYFDQSEAESHLAEFYRSTSEPVNSTASRVALKVAHPDIYLVILESFSTHLMPSMGGDVAVCLDSVASEGLFFTDFYAESFRTDRALTTILAAIPAQPTTSLLRYVNKFDKFPSLASELKVGGYETRYYYGGDIDFTNLRGFLVAQRFDMIVSDADFDVSKRLSKWGVHDEYVFERALQDVDNHRLSPRFSVIQTSSSHEPYEVPFNRFDDKKKNAFAYADDCLGRFIRGLKSSGEWDNALVVITADHWGSYPPDLKDYEQRHHVPLVIAGGALGCEPRRVDCVGSQSAIAGTVLSLVGMDWHGLEWTRDLLDDGAPRFAYMSEPSWFGLKTAKGLTVIGVDTGEPLTPTAADQTAAKAYIQCLYHRLSEY
jgi:phosphoglycerol transferase MdoB-like AlkP superfamily enzyme